MIKKKLYRWFQSKCIQPFILPFFFSQDRLKKNNHFNFDSQHQGDSLWFHAASTGELESLKPIIQSFFADSHFNIVVTIFSESAKLSLNQLKDSLEKENPLQVKRLYTGYSPWEGNWFSVLKQFKPVFFITVRYEAWPDLWLSLIELEIPLIILSAKSRSSLKWIKYFCEKMVKKLPKLYFFTITSFDKNEVLKLFPDSVIQEVGDPRWDQVWVRSQKRHPRVRELCDFFKNSPYPWGILGSVWKEDLTFLLKGKPDLKGTLWIVPHCIEKNNLKKIEKMLLKQDISFMRTSCLHAPTSTTVLSRIFSCILVDELGILSELYSLGDWSFVGGGFGMGIHSVIEPGLQGLPVGIGPRGIERFDEVAVLKNTGQLQVFTALSEVGEWLKKVQIHSNPMKACWIKNNQFQLGATQRIIHWMKEWRN